MKYFFVASAVGLPLLGLATLFAFAAHPARQSGRNPERSMIIPAPSRIAYRRLAEAVETNFQTQVLAKWFPQAIDREQGGFYQNFREDWSRDPKKDKGLVYQSRLTWVAAQAAARTPSQADTYRSYVRQGLDFLDTRLWDKEHGGFFWALGEDGRPERDGEKHAYGIAFGIYAASASYHATQEPRALDLAKRAYAWLEAHAHDRAHGGYYEALTRAGKPILAPAAPSDAAQNDFIGTHYGYKSMNSHIHLLEALTELYTVWPDAALRTRLQEMFLLVRDRIAVEPGCLNLFFTPDWRAIPDHDSFGHDVETAFLLVEASGALGKPNDAKTWTIARQLVNHALEYGWDTVNGGFYDAGTAFGSPLVTDKIWWTQGEGLNALMLMHARYGHEYLNAIAAQCVAERCFILQTIPAQNPVSRQSEWKWDIDVTHNRVQYVPDEAGTSGILTWIEEVAPEDDERGNGSHGESSQTLADFLQKGPHQSPPVAIVEAMLAYFQAKKPAWLDPYRLQIAASQRNLDLVRELLAQGVSAEMPVRGLTPMWFAVAYAEREMAETLFAAGVDVNRHFPGMDETILMTLASNAPDASWEPLAQQIIAQGVELEARNKWGQTALMHAATHGYRLPGLVEALLKAGADVNASSLHGYTLLMEAVSHYRVNVTSDMGRIAEVAIVQRLIAAGANVNAVDKVGNSALMRAISHGCVAGVQRLLEAGADVARIVPPTSKYGDPKSVLQFAIDYQNPEIIALVRAAGGK